MKKLLFFIFFLFSVNLFANENNLTIDANLKYYQNLSIAENSSKKLAYDKWGQDIQGDLELEGHLGDTLFANINLTHQNDTLTCERSYFKEAFIGINFHELVTLKVGCLRAHTFGWDQESYDKTSQITSYLRDELYQDKYRKLIELNLNLWGTFSTQFLEDIKTIDKQGQLALNFSWSKEINFITPVAQFSIYENYKSYSYTLGAKLDFDNFLIRFDAGQVRDQHREAETFVNLSPSYSFDGFFGASKKDSIELSFMGKTNQLKKFDSEYHLVHNLNIHDKILFFSGLQFVLQEKKSLHLNIGFKATL